MHRVSNFNAMFEGDYYFVRPVAHYDTANTDHPLIRGIINGRYLVLALTNPYLDPGETQLVEIWYGAPYTNRNKVWSGEVEIEARKTRLVQCALPALSGGKTYDPDKLYFRYTCVDGKFEKTFTVTGNYTVAYPYRQDAARQTSRHRKPTTNRNAAGKKTASNAKSRAKVQDPDDEKRESFFGD